MSRAALAAVLALALGAGCGGPGKPPVRGVLERDVEGWGFRRYQELLDVEVWVPGSRGVVHTASYARRAAEKGGRLGAGDVVSAVVTRYDKPVGVERALVKFVRRLAQDAAYKVEERSIEGVRLFALSGGGEAWVIWAARGHVVKLGGPSIEAVPDDLIEAYGERYPSRLESGALDGPLPPGPDAPAPKKPEPEPFDADDPKPDWQAGEQ